MPTVTTQSDILQKLKVFHASGRGLWNKVSDEDWTDWRWQLKNRVTSLEQLQEHIPNLSEAEIEGARLANTKLAMAITPHYFTLIDAADPECPIRNQVVPQIAETHTASWDMVDP